MKININKINIFKNTLNGIISIYIFLTPILSHSGLARQCIEVFKEINHCRGGSCSSSYTSNYTPYRSEYLEKEDAVKVLRQFKFNETHFDLRITLPNLTERSFSKVDYHPTIQNPYYLDAVTEVNRIGIASNPFFREQIRFLEIDPQIISQRSKRSMIVSADKINEILNNNSLLSNFLGTLSSKELPLKTYPLNELLSENRSEDILIYRYLEINEAWNVRNETKPDTLLLNITSIEKQLLKFERFFKLSNIIPSRLNFLILNDSTLVLTDFESLHLNSAHSRLRISEEFSLIRDQLGEHTEGLID